MLLLRGECFPNSSQSWTVSPTHYSVLAGQSTPGDLRASGHKTGVLPPTPLLKGEGLYNHNQYLCHDCLLFVLVLMFFVPGFGSFRKEKYWYSLSLQHVGFKKKTKLMDSKVKKKRSQRIKKVKNTVDIIKTGDLPVSQITADY